MAKSAMHDKIAAIALERGAMCLSAELLRAAVLDSLTRAVSFGTGTPVIFPTGNAAVEGKFKSISLDPKTLKAELVQDGAGFAVRVGPNFMATLELNSATQPPIAFCTIELDVNDVALPLEGSGDLIRISPSNSPVIARVVPSATRAEAIAASGITPDDLLRVEGSIAYVAGSRLISSALGEVPPINLKHLFPALSFDGALELHAVDGSLLVIPERFSIIGNPGCPKGDATVGVTIVAQNPVRADDGMTWTHHVSLPQLANRNFVAEGAIASTYLPKPILDVHFGKTTPAIAYRDSGSGFIGYDIEVTAAIRGIQVSIDPAVGGLRLEFDFATWGIATTNIDVPCVGRVDLAQAKFQMPKDNGTASVEALLRLAIDTGGRLIIVCELSKLDLGEAQVDVQLFSKYLGMAGGEAAVIGFVLDAVIGRVLAHNLPGLVFDAIRDAVNQHFFVLADLGDIAKYLKSAPNVPMFSGDLQSALMGSTYRG